MTPGEVLARLGELGVEARVDGQRLRLRGRGVTLASDLRTAIREQEQLLVYVLTSRPRRRLERIGEERGWPRVEFASGIALMAGEAAWAAFLGRADDRHLQLALAALGAGDPPPPLELPAPAPVRGAVPCPSCGNVAFSLAPDGRRRCDGPRGCGHTWQPGLAADPREDSQWA